MSVSGLPKLQPRLYPSSVKSERDAGHASGVLHNLYFYNTMMSEIRQAIEEGRYKEYKKQKLEGFLKNDKK